jgi:hypothetical protein
MGPETTDSALSEHSLSRRRFTKRVGAAVLGTLGIPLVSAAQATAEATSGVACNQENTFTKPQTIRLSAGAEGTALTLLADTPAEAGATLRLGNITAGASPADTAGLRLAKDSSDRWELGIDHSPGTEGDFNIYSFAAKKDIIYITDNADPGVGVGAVDRPASSGAQLLINNLSTARPTLVVNPKRGTTRPTLLLLRCTENAPNILECRDAALETLVARVANNGAFTSAAGFGMWNHAAPQSQPAAISGTTITDLKGSIDSVLKAYGMTG